MDHATANWNRSSPDICWPDPAQAEPVNFPFPPPVEVPSSWLGAGGMNPGYWNSNYPSNYPPGSGLSRESSRDDLMSLEFDQVFEYEERFRVDRRKLELLITGRFEAINETATDFFQRVGEETNTTVIWPSRLKIGAKSKKDPHIRIGGQEEGVIQAKAMVMEHLDTKMRRVTMKMDVSYTDHSHIIGKGGNTIRRVMSETGCHIHFPDSNRSNPNEKSNQVSIAGREMEGVEKARARVRELTPLIFTFDLPIIPRLDTAPDPNDAYLRAIQDQYNIQLTFRQKQKIFQTTMAVVKGCEWEAARVKEATLLLIDHFCGVGSVSQPTSSSSSTSTSSNGAQQPPNAMFPVSMNMEISPVHHSVVLGKNNINLKVIMQRTKTTILFQDAGDPNIPPIRKGSVTITGSIHNVYSARQQLLGSLPLVMMFDMPDNIEPIFDSEVHKIGEECDVSISIKPKHRQANKSVLIKAQERNASGIYAARHKLLKMDDEETLVVADIPESYKLQPLSAQMLSGLAASGSSNPPRSSGSHSPFAFPPHTPFNAFGNGNNAGGVGNLPMGANGSPLMPGPPIFGGSTPFSPYLMAQQSPWAGALANNSPFSNVLTPNHPYLQDYAWLVLSNITRLQQQQLLEQQHQSSGSSSSGRKKDDSNSSNNSGTDSNNNNAGWLNANGDANNNILPIDRNGAHSPPIEGTSPRNSSPVRVDGNLTNNLSKLDLNVTANDKILQLPYPEGNDDNVLSSSGLGTSASGTSTTANNTQNSVGEQEANNGHFGQLFLENFPDRRAPGCEIKTRQLVAQKQLDYDQKKLLATKAMQSKPAGEPRTPTPSWSGLGFSSSMPENIIKEKLAAEEMAKVAKLHNFASISEDNDELKNVSRQDPFKIGNEPWFGNSSAFDAMLNHSAKTDLGLNNTNGAANNVILATDDLPTLFAKQGLAKYTSLFVRHEVDLQTFGSLTDEDLREIGVQTFGARKKLLLLANKVKQTISDKW